MKWNRLFWKWEGPVSWYLFQVGAKTGKMCHIMDKLVTRKNTNANYINGNCCKYIGCFYPQNWERINVIILFIHIKLSCISYISDKKRTNIFTLFFLIQQVCLLQHSLTNLLICFLTRNAFRVCHAWIGYFNDQYYTGVFCLILLIALYRGTSRKGKRKDRQRNGWMIRGLTDRGERTGRSILQ